MREARPEDLGALQAFQQGLVAHERPMDNGIPCEGKVEYHDIEKLITSDDAHFLIAEIDGRPAGCGFGQIKENVQWALERRYGYIGLMFVEEEFRNLGIGRSLIKDLVQWFHSNGVQHIIIRLYSENEIAVNAYRKAGFVDFVSEMRYEPID